ncbi:uncharacterized protein MYCFIDRAFT_27361 [Pseudocercospora fijiensis CIRAD86]|uniref:F-box domain-containing protein n=1 Tax=Pseudocercospora fijiensis (strain CIRAD86) TaxID=383855 RepID=N1Q993_PSEFD|nr:uncharacterized protein MYCFIDRAFT_27361 [Pseudocercospora fijiensis CIRAD86]EME88361.1 hypothetical protein MYCFIDRAFT_27361 [Pseudocercospora fijiensis CIRAD86]
MTLQSFPSELVEAICLWLNAQDIGNLRLTCHAMRSKATQDHYQSFFVKQRISFSEEKLGAFVELTKSQDSPVSLVEELTIVGDHHLSEAELVDARENLEILTRRQKEQHDLRRTGRDVELLAEALKNLCGRSLRLITLEVCVYEEDASKGEPPVAGGNWRPIWTRAAEVLETTISALARSQFPLPPELDAFSELRRCAVPCDKIGRTIFHDETFQAAFHSLTAFSISISNRILNQLEDDTPDLRMRNNPDGSPINPLIPVVPSHDPEVLRAQAADESNFTGLPRLLNLCANLEKLDLHFYVLRTPGLQQQELHLDQIFHHIAKTTALTRLHSMRLRGFHLHMSDLLPFIQASPIRMLVLQNLYLESGTWQPLFDHCTADGSALEFLFFDDLFEGHKLLYFAGEGDGKPKFETLCGTQGKNTLVRRKKEEVGRGISYHFATERPYGSPECWMWNQARTREYGPPQGF